MEPATPQAAVKAQVKLAHSAETLKDSAVAQEDSADRRTELAADRTVLAAERTYAAWMRTGLAALASAMGAKALLDGHVPDALATAAAIVLLLFAQFCFVAGVWRQFDRGAPPPRPDVKLLPSWLLIGFNGFLFIVGLAVLVGYIVG